MQHSDTAVHIGMLVEKVADNTPWHNSCLDRAISCRDVLTAKGIESSIHLGVQVCDGNMSAHAWVCSNNRIVCGAAVRHRYTEITHLDDALLKTSFDTRMRKPSHNL
jgi:hypothetical protein